jgi:hypothetical protein
MRGGNDLLQSLISHVDCMSLRLSWEHSQVQCYGAQLSEPKALVWQARMWAGRSSSLNVYTYLLPSIS